MRRPVIETGASEWKSEMLPLHQRRFSTAARFELARAVPNCLAGNRLNHSAMLSPLSLLGGSNT